MTVALAAPGQTAPHSVGRATVAVKSAMTTLIMGWRNDNRLTKPATHNSHFFGVDWRTGNGYSATHRSRTQKCLHKIEYTAFDSAAIHSHSLQFHSLRAHTHIHVSRYTRARCAASSQQFNCGNDGKSVGMRTVQHLFPLTVSIRPPFQKIKKKT